MSTTTREGVRSGRLGDSALRPDGIAKTQGSFAFAGDLSADGFLWGATLRSPHPFARIVSIEPWAGAAFDYVFINDTEIDGLGGIEDSYSDLRLQAGFNFGLGSHAQLAITGELGGLLQDDLDTYAVEANLAIQF